MRPHYAAILLALALCDAGFARTIQYPLQLSADGERVLDASSQSVFFHAASPWHLVTRLTLEESDEFFAALRARGYNSLLMTAMVTADFGSNSVENVYGEAPFNGPAPFEAPNEAYFQHLDAVLALAEQYQLTVFLFPAYLGKSCGAEGWCQEMLDAGMVRLRDYGRWIGARYEDRPNLVWAHAGDADALEHGAMDELLAIVGGILEVDQVHLHTAHCSRYRSASSCYEFSWLAFETVYSDCSLSARAIFDAVQNPDGRPALFIEGRYEFESGATPVCIRSQAYWALLGGASGSFFGSGKIWDFPSWWRDGLESEGDYSMRILARVQRYRAAGHFEPDLTQSILIEGAGDLDGSEYAAAATSADGSAFVAYLPTPRSVRLDLDLLQPDFLEGWWIDPSNGAASFVGSFPSSGTREFASPYVEDGLLLVQDAQAGLVPFWELSTASATTPFASAGLRLSAAAPNPFNPRTTVRLSAHAGAPIELALFDARGRKLSLLFRGVADGAERSVTLDAEGLSSGVYWLRARSGDEEVRRSIVLLK